MQVLLRRVGALAITVLAAIAAMAAVNVSTLLLNVAVIVLTNFAADALQSTLDPRLVR